MQKRRVRNSTVQPSALQYPMAAAVRSPFPAGAELLGEVWKDEWYAAHCYKIPAVAAMNSILNQVSGCPTGAHIGDENTTLGQLKVYHEQLGDLAVNAESAQKQVIFFLQSVQTTSLQLQKQAGRKIALAERTASKFKKWFWKTKGGGAGLDSHALAEGLGGNLPVISGHARETFTSSDPDTPQNVSSSSEDDGAGPGVPGAHGSRKLRLRPLPNSTSVPHSSPSHGHSAIGAASLYSSAAVAHSTGSQGPSATGSLSSTPAVGNSGGSQGSGSGSGRWGAGMVARTLGAGSGAQSPANPVARPQTEYHPAPGGDDERGGAGNARKDYSLSVMEFERIMENLQNEDDARPANPSAPRPPPHHSRERRSLGADDFDQLEDFEKFGKFEKFGGGASVAPTSSGDEFESPIFGVSQQGPHSANLPPPSLKSPAPHLSSSPNPAPPLVGALSLKPQTDIPKPYSDSPKPYSDSPKTQSWVNSPQAVLRSFQPVLRRSRSQRTGQSSAGHSWMPPRGSQLTPPHSHPPVPSQTMLPSLPLAKDSPSQAGAPASTTKPPPLPPAGAGAAGAAQPAAAAASAAACGAPALAAAAGEGSGLISSLDFSGHLAESNTHALPGPTQTLISAPSMASLVGQNMFAVREYGEPGQGSPPRPPPFGGLQSSSAETDDSLPSSGSNGRGVVAAAGTTGAGDGSTGGAGRAADMGAERARAAEELRATVRKRAAGKQRAALAESAPKVSGSDANSDTRSDTRSVLFQGSEERDRGVQGRGGMQEPLRPRTANLPLLQITVSESPIVTPLMTPTGANTVTPPGVPTVTSPGTTAVTPVGSGPPTRPSSASLATIEVAEEVSPTGSEGVAVGVSPSTVTPTMTPTTASGRSLGLFLTPGTDPRTDMITRASSARYHPSSPMYSVSLQPSPTSNKGSLGYPPGTPIGSASTGGLTPDSAKMTQSLSRRHRKASMVHQGLSQGDMRTSPAVSAPSLTSSPLGGGAPRMKTLTKSQTMQTVRGGRLAGGHLRYAAHSGGGGGYAYAHGSPLPPGGPRRSGHERLLEILSGVQYTWTSNSGSRTPRAHRGGPSLSKQHSRERDRGSGRLSFGSSPGSSEGGGSMRGGFLGPGALDHTRGGPGHIGGSQHSWHGGDSLGPGASPEGLPGASPGAPPSGAGGGAGSSGGAGTGEGGGGEGGPMMRRLHSAKEMHSPAKKAQEEMLLELLRAAPPIKWTHVQKDPRSNQSPK